MFVTPNVFPNGFFRKTYHLVAKLVCRFTPYVYKGGRAGHGLWGERLRNALIFNSGVLLSANEGIMETYTSVARPVSILIFTTIHSSLVKDGL